MKLLGISVVLVLSGCSMPYMPNVSLNSRTEQLAPDYRESLRSYFGSEAVLISEPRRMNAWSVLDPGIWYVCVKRASREEEVYALSKGRIEGTISVPRSKIDGAVVGSLANYCTNAHFEKLP